ncbi:MAG: dienelactone hydrolase family protein [Blastocatellia bacterium]|nr:dienelactone hydrolase family protein [Blastocatellia bacterium]
MKLCTLLLFILSTFAFPDKGSSDKIVKETFESQGKKRTYYLFVPQTVKAPAPMILMLHGSGRNGLILVEKWKELAKEKGIILVGPDSTNSAQWSTATDGPDFLYDLVEAIKSKHPVNPRRVYMFGHSAGAVFALYMSLFESEYFAAAAVHAGSLAAEDYELIAYAKRKTPIVMFVGTNDRFFPLAVVRATRDALNSREFSVELTEISNHGHNYYDRSKEINKSAWEFLSKQELAQDPLFQRYTFNK